MSKKNKKQQDNTICRIVDDFEIGKGNDLVTIGTLLEQLASIYYEEQDLKNSVFHFLMEKGLYREWDAWRKGKPCRSTKEGRNISTFEMLCLLSDSKMTPEA